MTLVLTGIAVWLAFKYINRDQERSSKEKTVAWLEGFTSRSKGQIRKKRAKVADIESSGLDELQGSITRSSESSDSRASLHTSQVQDETEDEDGDEDEDEDEDGDGDEDGYKTMLTRSASAATWPMDRKAQLKHPHNRGRGRVVDPELLRQGEPQEPTSSSENPNPTTAPHTPQPQDEVTSIRSI